MKVSIIWLVNGPRHCVPNIDSDSSNNSDGYVYIQSESALIIIPLVFCSCGIFELAK